MSTTDDTTIATPSRGHRLRRAATRTAVVLGFAVGGWLVATGSASADTAPPPAPPTSGTLLGGAGSLLGSVSTPLAPAATALTAPVAPVAPVVTAVVTPVAPVVAAVTAPVAPVVAAVVAPVLAPVVAALAPVAPVVAAVVAPVLAPVTVTLAPATTEDPYAVVQGAVAVVDSAPAQPATSTGANASAVGGPVAAGPVTLPAAPAARATTAGDPEADSTTPAASAASTTTPMGAPTEGPVLPVGTTPAAPVGAPGTGSGTTSTTGLGQFLAVVADPAALHLRTRSSRTTTSDEVSLPAFVADPGFSPD